MDIHPSTIRNYLDNITKPNKLILKSIADYFNVSFDWLMDGVGDMESPNSLAMEPAGDYGTTEDPELIKVFAILDDAYKTGSISAEDVSLVRGKIQYLLGKYTNAKDVANQNVG